MARITLAGFYDYDPTLFEGMKLPDGMSNDILISKLIRDYGMLYPYHQYPDILKDSISYWFQGRAYDFEQMYSAMHAKYNPIENYDRKEDRTLHLSHSGTDTDTTTLGSQVTTKRTGTETDAQSGSDVNELSVSAYDSASYQPRERNTRTPNLTATRTPNLTDTSENSGSDRRDTDYGHKEDTDEHIRAHGNIGVTTNQQMITSELEMRVQYDLYHLIAALFEQEFLSRCYS